MVVRKQNTERISILSLDPSGTLKDLKEPFAQMDCDILFHTELEVCMTCIQSIEEKNESTHEASQNMFSFGSLFSFILKCNTDFFSYQYK